MVFIYVKEQMVKWSMSMTKAAYSVRELVELGLGSQSHIRRLMKANIIPVIRLGHRELIPAYWVEDNFLKPAQTN
ncbi:MAG TPA: hypothetical protein DCX14_08675 [Flavobacteriales bacterium]|nr:hypothetical protein [Flavobacteriales bacterium]